MNSNNHSRLPECIGKKIVEALKQDEQEVRMLEDEPMVNFVQPQNVVVQEPTFDVKSDFKNVSAVNTVQESQLESKLDVSDLELPDNVMMLVRLINQLPAGVSRQVGAQIIRQTIEAMGISMKAVLSEAQYIQEDLGNSTQDCINTIEEYKNNIKILEQKITTYKRQASKLGELINLFVMTIK